MANIFSCKTNYQKTPEHIDFHIIGLNFLVGGNHFFHIFPLQKYCNLQQKQNFVAEKYFMVLI